MWHHKSPTTLKVQAQNWTTKLAKVVQRSKPVLDVCVCFCMNWLEWESRQVSERWTFVRGRPAAHYLFMLMYLTSQLIAAGAGAQLPTASCSRTVSHSQEAGGWITYLPWLTPCVLFTFAHLKLNSKQTASVSVYRGCLLAGARERKRQKCWEREGNLFTGAWQVFGFVAVSMTDKGKVFILLFVSLVVSCVCVCVCVCIISTHCFPLFYSGLQWGCEHELCDRGDLHIIASGSTDQQAPLIPSSSSSSSFTPTLTGWDTVLKLWIFHLIRRRIKYILKCSALFSLFKWFHPDGAHWSLQQFITQQWARAYIVKRKPRLSNIPVWPQVAVTYSWTVWAVCATASRYLCLSLFRRDKQTIEALKL